MSAPSSESHAAGTVFSIEKVGDELAAIADELSAWATARGPRFFLPLAPPMLAELRAVSSWAGGQGYDQGAVMTFLQVADSYLVAQALVASTVEGHTLYRDAFRMLGISKLQTLRDFGQTIGVAV